MAIIHFKGFEPQYKDFPTKIDVGMIHPCLDKANIEREESFEKSISRAQEMLVPAYLFAVVQMKDDTFEVDDCDYLNNHLFKNYRIKVSYQIPEKEEIKNPAMDRCIKKIHFFALPCFSFSKGELKEQEMRGELEALYIDTTQLSVDDLDSHEVAKLFIDSCNYRLLEGILDEKDPRSILKILLHTRGSMDSLLKNKSDLVHKLGGEEVWAHCSRVVFDDMIELNDKYDNESPQLSRVGD
ncbi:MAG: hypothetical protein WAM28_08220 [Chlamydiales bacterium]